MTEEELTRRSNWVGFIVALGLILLFSFSLFRQYRRSPRVTQAPDIPKQKADVILYFTANRQGKLEICGCPGKRAEDLSKVASGLYQVSLYARRAGSRVAVLEGGDFAGSAEVIPYLLQCYQIMGYEALALSPRDMQFYPDIKKWAKGISLLTPPNDGTFSSFIVRNDAKGFTIGVVNLGEGAPTSQAAVKRAQEYLRHLRERCQVVIGVSYATSGEVKKIQRDLKGLIDLLLVDEPTFVRLRSAAYDGATQQDGDLPPIHRLPHLRSNVLSVLIWAGKDGSRPTIQPSEIPIFGQSDEPRVKRIVDRYFEVRQERLKKETARLLQVAVKKDYVTPEFCGSCHQAQYNQWKETGHARAIVTLEEKGRIDSQCLTCHSLEFRLRGVVTEKKNRGVECADCHTNLLDPAQARLHGQRPGDRPIVPTVAVSICVRCHDKQNSPDFDYTTALAKVSH